MTDLHPTGQPLALPGHLRWPFPVPRCQSATCPDPVLTPATEAVLFGHVESGKFVVFCGVCSLTVELFDSRFAIVGI